MKLLEKRLTDFDFMFGKARERERENYDQEIFIILESVA